MTFGARKRGPRSLRQLGGRGVLRGVAGGMSGVAEEARTGFAAPAFAGCALVEGATTAAVQWLGK
jgi:hypothetical protein